MCGRFFLISPFIAIAGEFGLSERIEIVPRPDITPGQEIAAVVKSGRDGASDRRLVRFRWGLVPSWAEDPSFGKKLFNARVETIADKPSFREAFSSRRCLIVADGFFEWQKDGKAKTPYLIRLPSRKPFGMAGLYEKWTPPGNVPGEPVYSCTIITVPADGTVSPVHDRMPAIIPKELHDLWLDPKTSQKEIRALIDSLCRAEETVGLEAVRLAGPGLPEESS